MFLVSFGNLDGLCLSKAALPLSPQAASSPDYLGMQTLLQSYREASTQNKVLDLQSQSDTLLTNGCKTPGHSISESQTFPSVFARILTGYIM